MDYEESKQEKNKVWQTPILVTLFFHFKAFLNMKQVFFLIYFSFLFSFCVIAESPPGNSQAQIEIEMNHPAQALPSDAPNVANLVEGNHFLSSGHLRNEMPHYLFQLPVDIPKSTPAFRPGNNRYSYGQGNDLNKNIYKINESTEANAPTNTNADFKVGWQGTVWSVEFK